jgi:hypothetical protein
MPSLRSGLFAAGGLLAVGAIAAGVYGVLTAEPPEPATPPFKGVIATPFLMPGKTRPPTVPAAAANLPDDEPVIGVTAGGRARGYWVRAFAGVAGHVVNDVVGGVPVTVTHWPQDGRSRVFTGDGSDPLPVMTGGFTDGLLLKVGDSMFHQRDGRPLNGSGPSFPYPDLAFQEVPWHVWRTAHPDTDVYVGDVPPKPPAGKVH